MRVFERGVALIPDRRVVLAARGVTAKDSGGTSDVYCQVYLDKEKVLKTEVLKKTVDPVFEHEKGKLLYVHTRRISLIS